MNTFNHESLCTIQATFSCRLTSLPLNKGFIGVKCHYLIKLTAKKNVKMKSKTLSAPKLKLHWQLIKNILPLWFLALEELFLLLNIDWNVPGQRIGLILNLKKFTLDNTLLKLSWIILTSSQSFLVNYFAY